MGLDGPGGSPGWVSALGGRAGGDGERGGGGDGCVDASCCLEMGRERHHWGGEGHTSLNASMHTHFFRSFFHY